MTAIGFAAARQAFLIVLEVSDIAHDRLDLRVAERAVEGGHGAFLAFFDAMNDEIVAARRARELRAFSGFAAAILVTPAAGGGEELLHLGIIARLLRCSSAGTTHHQQERRQERQR